MYGETAQAVSRPLDMSSIPLDVAARRGRPRKFATPSRPVTITLPEDVIRALSALDSDLSRAIVRLTQPVLRTRRHAPAELVSFGGHAIIVVNPTPTLAHRQGISLLRLPDGRALISFDQSMSIPGLELMAADATADGGLSSEDRRVFEAIAAILRDARRSPDVRLEQRNIIVVEGRRRSASRSANGRKQRTTGSL